MTFHQKDENRQCYSEMPVIDYTTAKTISLFFLKDKLAVIDGLEGYLIAESDNVLLICKKDEEHSIRKYVNDAQIKLGEDYI